MSPAKLGHNLLLNPIGTHSLLHGDDISEVPQRSTATTAWSVAFTPNCFRVDICGFTKGGDHYSDPASNSSTNVLRYSAFSTEEQF